MTVPSRPLLTHPVLRSLVFERLLLVASATLAAAALVSGRVRPASAGAAGFRALLYGVNAGGCAQLFTREGGDPRAFWRSFLPVNAALLVLLVAASLLLLAV